MCLVWPMNRGGFPHLPGTLQVLLSSHPLKAEMLKKPTSWVPVQSPALPLTCIRLYRGLECIYSVKSLRLMDLDHNSKWALTDTEPQNCPYQKSSTANWYCLLVYQPLRHSVRGWYLKLVLFAPSGFLIHMTLSRLTNQHSLASPAGRC